MPAYIVGYGLTNPDRDHPAPVRSEKGEVPLLAHAGVHLDNRRLRVGAADLRLPRGEHQPAGDAPLADGYSEEGTDWLERILETFASSAPKSRSAKLNFRFTAF
jgi:hypothetical protein